MSEQNIEQLFKNKFSNFEADVNPNAWSNIQHGLQSPVPSHEVAGNAASTGKTIGLWGYAGLFVAVSAVVITAVVYNNSDKKPSDEIAAVTNSVPAVTNNAKNSFEPVVLNEISPAVVKNSPVENLSSNNNSKQESVAAVQEKKETVVAEKQSSVTPTTVKSAEPENSGTTSAEQAGEQKLSPSENNSDAAEKTTPVTTENSQTLANDFYLATEPSDNSVPREQESRSDFAFYIPTVFTPNGDMVNDDFKPMGLHFKDYELVIYDGNSNEIFRSKDIEHKWDGKLKDGTLAPSGLYAVVISVKDLNNVEHPYRGPLTLKR